MFNRRLVFKPHPYIPGHTQAKYNGYSVIEGPMINKFEVMDREGDVHSGLSMFQAIQMVLR